MTYDPYERCRRSLEKAQAEYDAMQPPDYYDLPGKCPNCGEKLAYQNYCRECDEYYEPSEPDPIQEREDYLAEEADRIRDES